MFHEIATGSVVLAPVQTPQPPAERYDDLWQLGLADPRTGLPNQLLLLDRLSQALNRRRRHGGDVAVIHVVAANLGDIIDEFGYSCGELVLSEMSRRMASVLRTEDTIGRSAGRELIAVLEIEDEEVIGPLTHRLHSVLTDTFTVSGKPIRVAVKLGLAIAGDAEAAEEVLMRADRATLSPQAD
jgi:diguanylate cyclase (GGDEF)-like protein